MVELPRARQYEPSMWLSAAGTVCTESHRTRRSAVLVQMHHRTSFRQLLQFHSIHWTDVDIVAVRFLRSRSEERVPADPGPITVKSVAVSVSVTIPS